MLRRLFLATTAIAALSGAAAAADLGMRAPPPVFVPPAFTWTGFYVGASAGLIRNSSKMTDDYGLYLNAGDTLGNSADGGIFGIDAGYNWQAGAFVFGLEGDISLATASSSTNLYGGGLDPAGNGFTETNKLQSLGTIRGRLGYAVDRALFYVTGGWAFGEVKHSVSAYDYAPYGGSTSSWRNGWVFGGGIEYAFTPNWTARVEGLYADLGSSTVNGAHPEYCRYGFKDTAVIVRAGVNYKF
jgi:outer membrane immunogenic protein